MSMDRRTFLTQLASAGGAVLASPLLSNCERAGAQQPIARVAFVKTSDRAAGVGRAIDLLQTPRFQHEDMKLRDLGAGPLTLGGPQRHGEYP